MLTFKIHRRNLEITKIHIVLCNMAILVGGWYDPEIIRLSVLE